MRSLAIFALVAAALLSSAPSMAQTPGSQNERTYGWACPETGRSCSFPTATIRIGHFDAIRRPIPTSVGTE